ncbi:MAG: TonB-dependent receptor [Prevotellaceae bacterium]|jgi:outer membrane cobalamin receptor|nr:TonB-dependent receptor [Prevotellaceae bacterium]
MQFLPRSIFLINFTFYILHSTFCNAQSDSTKIYSLDSVQVVGKKTANEIIPAQKLSGALLQNLSSQSIADAVRFFSGVQVKDYGGIGGLKTVNIRSMGTNQMGVFYDGIQLGNAQNGQIDLGRFSLDNIESISIYNGQKSSMLQSAKDYGAAGTIYIQTRSPQFADNKNFNITARFKTGSFGVINPSLFYEQKISNKISLSLSSEFLNANGRYKYHFQTFNTHKDTVLTRKNGDITSLRTEAALFGKFNSGEWKFQLYNYHSERGLAGYVSRNVYEHFDRQADNNFFAQGSVKKHFRNYSLLFNAKYANDFVRYTADYRRDTTFTDYTQNELYLSLAHSYRPFKIWEIALATDFQVNNLFSNREDFGFPTRCTLLAALSSSVKLNFAKIQASLLGTFVKDEVKIGVARQQKPQFTPAVMATFSPFKHFPLDFRTFAKRIFRMPTFNDLYYTIATNSYLKPEFVQQYDLGFEYILNKSQEPRAKSQDRFVRNFSVSADVYYNLVENKIVAMQTSNPFRWQMTNFGMVKILGVDFSADIEFLLHKDLILNVLANYSFQDARDYSRKSDFEYGHLIPYAPQHCATAAANFQYKNFRLNYCFIYTGERFSRKGNIAENHIRAFQTHDVSAGYVFLLEPRAKSQEPRRTKNQEPKAKKSQEEPRAKTSKEQSKKLIINLDINNIFNQHYEVILNYPMPSTNFKIGVTLEL